MKKLAYASIISAMMLCPLSAFAADTTEPLDPGAIEFDPEFTIDNIRDGKPSVGGGIAFAMGAFEGLTLSGAIGFGSDLGLVGGGLSAGVNVTYGAVDTDNFDLDVMMDLEYDGGFGITPSVELNYDLRPDQELWGLYLRAGLPIYGGFDGEELLDDDHVVADVGLSLTLGTYLTFGEIFQVLLEGGFTVENLAQKAGDTALVEPVLSLGFNVVVNDNFELITDFSINLPAPDEDDYKFSGALTIGGAFSFVTTSDASSASGDDA